MAIYREVARIGDQELIIETGRMARQAGGSVVVQYGESMVLCTATAGGLRNIGFFPLVCDYVENQWAAGSIPGGYFKREAKPSTKATLTSRLIDRPMRPLFPKTFLNETQIVAWVISADRINDTDVLSITGSSAALMLSDIPFAGPVVGIRVGRVDGKFIANPTFEQRERSDMDVIMAVTPDSIVMVEGSANEMPDDIMIDALDFGRDAAQDAIQAQIRMAEAIGKPKMGYPVAPSHPKIEKEIEKRYGKKMVTALQVPEKNLRYEAINAVKAEAVEYYTEKNLPELEQYMEGYRNVRTKMSREMILDGKRMDGRGPKDIREITIEAGYLPRSHGSSIFTRGETQTLVSVTLGTEREAQRLDTLEGDETRNFMLHYNFPGFCVGEVKPFRTTARREIGHGFLAERALLATLPDLPGEFPYTIRIVSDVLESNGSSSMASVCGGSIALMDAGVPVKRHTAGIAMGLIKEGDRISILSDILGDEDHLGDMDFKICGTERGITAFQLDTKIKGLNRETMNAALAQAREGREHILKLMNAILPEPRKDLAETAPRVVKIKVPVSAIGAVIGQGGSTIRGIQEATGTTVMISDDGTVSISSSNALKAQQAIEIIEGLTATPDIGGIYMGTVKKVVDFGAFIEILPGTEGLCHISELTEGRVDSVDDILKEGDEVLVKVLEMERGGKIRLSRRAALSEKGEVDLN